ncbi:MAG: acyltransferase domain-containing protein [Nitrosomonadales bacterium]|nr:acyltransferase domain-containing protein [Nitrosomonadales bacterium]
MSLAILCSGQGAQHPAMLNMIADHPAANEVIKAGEAALGINLRDALMQRDEIFRNAIAQPLICLTQLAFWTALRQDAPKPAAFCGYSVGELAAYACAGALDVAELAHIARARAALMDSATAATHGGLLALQGLSRDDVTRLCEGLRTWIAIAIGEEEFVIGGEDAALTQLSKELAERGAKLTPLKVGLASHTPLLVAAAQPFRALLEASSMKSPDTPVVAGIDAAWVVRRDTAIDKLALQLDHTIEWSICMDMLYERGCRVFLELGPGRALARMMQARYADVDARAVDDFRSLDGVATWLSKHCPNC